MCAATWLVAPPTGVNWDPELGASTAVGFFAFLVHVDLRELGFHVKLQKDFVPLAQLPHASILGPGNNDQTEASIRSLNRRPNLRRVFGNARFLFRT